MSETLDYITSHLEGIANLDENSKQRIVKTSLALLKIREIDGFPMKNMMMFMELRREVEADFLKDKEKSFKTRLPLHEAMKATGNFPGLSDGDAVEVKKYLENFLPKIDTSNTLERYMAEKLGAKSEVFSDPDSFSTPDSKMRAVVLAMFHSGEDIVEDFQLNLKEEVSTEKVKEIMAEFYEKENYTFEDRGDMIYIKEEGSKKFFITLSNHEYVLLVTVNKTYENKSK